MRPYEVGIFFTNYELWPNSFTVFRSILLPDAASLTNRDHRGPMAEYIHRLEESYAAHIVFLQAQHYIQAGGTANIEKAIAKWDVGRRFNPRDPRFEMEMIKHLHCLGQSDAPSKRKNINESIVEVCGYFLSKKDFPPNALTALQETDIYLIYAPALANLDRNEEAQNAYHNALKLDPTCHAAKEALKKVKENQESKRTVSEEREPFPLPLGPEDTTLASVEKAREHLQHAQSYAFTDPKHNEQLKQAIEQFESAHNNLISKLCFYKERSDLYTQIQLYCRDKLAVWKAEAVLLYIQNDDISTWDPVLLFEREAFIWRALRYTTDDNMNMTLQQLRLELLRTQFRKLSFEPPERSETVVTLSQDLEKFCNEKMRDCLSRANWLLVFRDCTMALKQIDDKNYHKWQEKVETGDFSDSSWTIVSNHRRRRTFFKKQNENKLESTTHVFNRT